MVRSVRPSLYPARARIATALALLGIGWTALFSAAGTPSTAETLSQLEASLSAVRTVRTRFVQVKRLALFKTPLTTRGVIQVETPDRLLWRVETPIRYVLVIDGQQAKQWDGETGKTQKIPLAKNPVFSAVTEQLRAWFGGRYTRLANDYTITPKPGSPLALVFTPKPGTPPEKMLKAVTVTFRDDKRYITSIRIDESSGDETTLTFEATELNITFSPEEWEL